MVPSIINAPLSFSKFKHIVGSNPGIKSPFFKKKLKKIFCEFLPAAIKKSIWTLSEICMTLISLYGFLHTISFKFLFSLFYKSQHNPLTIMTFYSIFFPSNYVWWYIVAINYLSRLLPNIKTQKHFFDGTMN